MSYAIITLSNKGLTIARKISSSLEDCEIFLHEDIEKCPDVTLFSSSINLTAQIFEKHKGLIYILPTGVAVRAIAPCLKHKLTDPAVVVMDVGARYAISLLSGHEGGANELALRVSNIVFSEPVITTTSEMNKNLIVGIGCKRGSKCEDIASAVSSALESINQEMATVRLLASIDLKKDEEGLLEFSCTSNIPVRFIPAEYIKETCYNFASSNFVEETTGAPGVCEPAALLCGRKTRLILKKTITNGITVAIAEENCW